MADGDEETILEEQLHSQLYEQRDSINAVADALSCDPQNPELLSVHEELVQAIKDAEKALFGLKRARLLREADTALQGSFCADGVKVDPRGSNEIEAEQLVEPRYSVGSKCRFRHTDGRWYSGLVVGLEGSETAKITFLTPTSENMVMCKFFLQQRCRFASNCRLSHGMDVPVSSLKRYVPTIWDQSLVGSSIWALSDPKAGVWREAELESWDGHMGVGEVVFRDDGSSAKLGIEAMTLSEYAHPSDEQESASSESYDSSDYDDENPQGLGFLESSTLQRGIQTDTALFATWENHTRGIASKMMANMGYREGMGLGASGQGILDPVSVKVLPPKQSLDDAVKTKTEETKDSEGKKRSRGGKRKRDKKLSAAIKAAEDEEESKDVFSLINTQLAKHGQMLNREPGKKQQQHQRGNGEVRKEDRRALVACEDEMKNLRTQVEKLEEMANRNRKEKPVYEAAMRKLNETRRALANAEEAHLWTSNAVSRKEKEKKWLKF